MKFFKLRLFFYRFIIFPCRVLMRREQVLKICLNHVLSAEIEYRSKDDKTWLFCAPDFSEGEINRQQFCLRFKTAELAQAFKKAVENALEQQKDKNGKIIVFDTVCFCVGFTCCGLGIFVFFSKCRVGISSLFATN